jgi:acetyltransferase-like isoleucine patch superfamily enzyme
MSDFANRARDRASSLLARARGISTFGVQHGTRFRVGPRVSFGCAGRIRVGDDVALYGNSHLDACGPKGSIEIGNETHVDHFCVLYGQGGLRIGQSCAIAAGVIIYTQTNQYAANPAEDVIRQPVVYAPVEIGDDVWIGARAVILPGVRIGSHAVIAAGAVVREDVEPWMIVAGVPARPMKRRL